MAKKKKTSQESIPWVEKYRPTKLKYVIGNKDIIDNIEAHLEENSVQNLEFIGAAGIGKTTVAMIIADVLSGHDKDNVKFVNASMFGRQGFLINEIIPFCKSSTLGSDKKKVIVLDEFDHSSKAMQASFRRATEEYTKNGNCVFILTCNFPRMIIEAIHSRCAKFTFKKVSVDEMMERAKLILKKEGIEYTDDDLSKVVELSDGKPRDMIQSLQQCSMKGNLIVPEKAEYRSLIAKMLRCLLKPGFRDLEGAIKMYEDISRTYIDDAREMLLDMHKLILENDSGDPELKGKLLRSIADTDYRLSVDTDPNVQMIGALVTFYFMATPYVNRQAATSSNPPVPQAVQ
jgi:DNA polymerase III delta prime subunit